MSKISVSIVLSLLAVLPLRAQAAPEHQAGHGHGGHGMILPESKNFPTIAYDETKKPRPVQRVSPPAMAGDPAKGKHLAYAGNKGRCLGCHILGADGAQAGDVGPNLSTYGKSGRDDAYAFQQIWDARAHNPATVMPPFGTDGVLTRHEVMDIVAYLNTLRRHVDPSARPRPQARNYDVAGEDFTPADAYIEQGEVLFQKSADNGPACAGCHAAPGGKGPDLKGAAVSYPKYDPDQKRVIALAQRINVCRRKYQHSEPYHLGSKPSNLLTSYVKFLSRGLPLKVATDGPAAAAFERGKASFMRKTGRLNFSCADCHNAKANKWLRGQQLNAIKPGGAYSGTAATWPRHFIAGHDLGLITLRQRARHCQIVTQTYPLPLHAQEYTDLVLYMTALANGYPMQAPTMSRLRGQD
jgi:sulfur-oxidizing protein SoxA